MTVTGATYRIFGNIEFRRKCPADTVILTAARGDVSEQTIAPEEEFRVRRRIADLTLIGLNTNQIPPHPSLKRPNTERSRHCFGDRNG